MASRPVAGTALEAALRVADGSARLLAPETIPEAQRYLVVDSDPSQERAVFAARRAPGLLVEGPPGTGKSQTIVNIVADSIGRHEKVLVVCQKQAALRVVEKRLQAERLGNRLFVVTDVNRDRTMVLRELRAQLERLRRDGRRAAAIERDRHAVAARIEALETTLNRQHAALQTVDDLSGVSYRTLVAELIALETDECPVNAPALRAVVGRLGRAELLAVEDECAPLAALWLAARYEGSALAALRPFATDDAMLGVFQDRFRQFEEAERDRDTVGRTGDALDVDDPQSDQAWLDAHAAMFRNMPSRVRRNLAAWVDHFRSRGSTAPPGLRVIATLEDLASSLAGLVRHGEDMVLSAALVPLAPIVLEEWRAVAERATARVSLVGRLNPLRFIARRKLAGRLGELGRPRGDDAMAAFRDAVRLELALRSARPVLEGCRGILGVEPAPSSPESLSRLIDLTTELLADLRPVASAAAVISACPHAEDAEAFARAGTAEAFEAFVQRLEGGFARFEARRKSLETLDALMSWFSDDWTAVCRARIVSGASNEEVIQYTAAAMPTVAAYQRFRIRAEQLTGTARETLAVLRASEAAFSELPFGQVGQEVRRTISREGRLAWKARIEAAEPALLVEPDEIETRVRALATEDAHIRRLNQDLLLESADLVASDAAWEEITRLRGPRARRLREVVDRGVDLGLMRLRPVWLTNPDVASRLLPLSEGLFDVVVFDEASQLPVEFALPALYRARRVVVSGDEKQMPPTSFFVTRLGSDEDSVGDEDEIEENITEQERMLLEEGWNRREIKDCPDLLALARTVLPSTTLQIHYRSKYRELIAFSNAAFYAGRLSVPARHPDGEIVRVRPIQVVKAGTPYEDQTNPGEAALVADLLAEEWRGRRFEDRPSVGVVTFNRRQADLIDDVLEARAESDPDFRRALEQEMTRMQDGEDMGFFVKNLENVQGDERDVIVFSTTFGRDATGTFRRYFGALGQRGGERRLNVAITRARERVVIVSSLPVREISDLASTERMPRSPRDFLQAYMDYVTKLSDGALDRAHDVTRRLLGEHERGGRSRVSEPDGFVTDVERFIRQLGYDPVSGGEAGAFSVDFTIEDPRTGLFGIGIECDGPRDDLLTSARAREVWRPAVLGKALPRLYRVRCRQWFHDRPGEQQRLAEAIADAIGRRSSP
jgi:DNA polymerase III delta prime subunit